MKNNGRDVKHVGFDEVAGCSLRGYVRVTRDRLVEMFGEPNAEKLDSKTNNEWYLTIDGTPVTIYDYKDDSSNESDKEVMWHIGGKDYGSVLKIQWCGLEKAVTIPEYMEGVRNVWGFELKKVTEQA